MFIRLLSFIILLAVLMSGLCSAEELVNEEGLYSFKVPDGWKSEIMGDEHLLLASPPGADGYRFRVFYMDFPDKAKLSHMPRIFSGSSNFILTETRELFGASLWAYGANRGVYLKGYFVTPEGVVNVEEIYLIAGLRGYGLYFLSPSYENTGVSANDIASTFKIDPLVYEVVVAVDPNSGNGDGSDSEVEFVVPEDGVDVALYYKGAEVEGAREEFGTADAMIDGQSTGYTEFFGFTNALIGESLTVCLDQAYLLNKIDILFYDLDRSYYQYTIEVSLDKENWTMLEDRSFGEWYAWQYISFTERPVKYIKVSCQFVSSYEANYKIVELNTYLIKTE